MVTIRFVSLVCLAAACTTDAPVPEAEPTPDAPQPEPPPPPPGEAPKAVYILSNEADANRVVVFQRANDGSLRADNAYTTGGRGSAGGLGTQGALVFDAAAQRFFAVNAGDHTVSMLALESDGSLRLLSNASAGGIRPVSITFYEDLVYVVNAGDTTTPANISGYRITGDALVPLAGSSKPLSAAQPGPGQIAFSLDGSLLVVTEKGTDQIVTYAVASGLAGNPTPQPSRGQTPFGFAWSPSGQLLVSEAFGGSPGLGAASSYSMGSNGTLSVVSPSLGSGQGAPCWVVYANGHAYTTNTASDTISAYTVGSDGTLTLDQLDGIAAQTAGGPIDADASDGNGFLYALNARGDSLGIYAIAANGALTRMPELGGISVNGVGLIAR